ncbi:MAG: SurA N-terminal domain-containing protein [Clostridiales bacterium]|nr:SurA N-terminal domain-containing protein [Clostridiales bacterium]
MNKAKRVLTALGIIVLITALLAACGGAKQPRTIGGISLGEHKVIATVNGESIYEDVYMEWYLETMSLSLGLDMSAEQDEQVASFLEEYKYSYLVGYAEQIALLQQAKNREIAATEQEVQEYISQIMMMYQADAEYFAALLAMWGFTDDTFHQYLHDQITLQQLYTSITDNVAQSDMSPREYYDAFPEEFEIGETRVVRHILVEAVEDREEVLALLNDGADFDELVAIWSTDPGAEINGGSYGPFNSAGMLVDGSGSLVEPFTDAAFALENVGDFTQEPAESEFGFHIIILDDIIDNYSMPFDEIEEDIAAHLLSEAKDNYFNEYYNTVMESAVITYADGVPTY